MSNCIHHPDVLASAYCRSCGKALCEPCQHKLLGTIYCEEHKPMEPINANATAAGPSVPPPIDPYGSPYQTNPYQAAAAPRPGDPSASPGLAFLLGFIPGVGAIYNGQYAKGLVHVVVLGLLITIVNNRDLNGGLEPLFGFMIAAWIAYMAFEAYHTAERRRLGQVVDEFSSLIPMDNRANAFPVGPVLLIGAGVFFLLANFDLIRIRDIIRFWPVGLIAAGAYMLYVRLTNNGGGSRLD